MTKQPAACGTRSGYNRHQRSGEPTCDECRRAVREYQYKVRGYQPERRNLHPHGTRLTVSCEHCGTQFTTTPAQSVKRRYCSIACCNKASGIARTIRSADDSHLERSHREASAPGLTYTQRRTLMAKWNRQNRSCAYCPAPATTIDHVLPLVRGGTNHEGNLAPCCKSCNSSKAGWTVIEWRTGIRLAPMRRPVTYTAQKRRCEGCAGEYQPKSSAHRYCAKKCRTRKPATPPVKCQVCAADCPAPRRVVCSDECERVRYNDYMRNRYRESVGIPVSAPLYTRAA